MRVLLVLAIAVAACATPKDAFVCTDSSQCKDGNGTCEANGFCSFADPTCPSGKRFGEAGSGLSDQCVVNPNGDFDLAMAASTSNTSVAVTFSQPPDPAAAVVLANYSVNGLTLSGPPVLSGSTVTFSTSVQDATMYSVTAANITRASDGAPLFMATVAFIGRAPFDVAGAAATTHSTMAVTFDAPPEAASATNLTNYTVNGLSLTGTPTLSGSTVTITTGPQSVTTYTVTVGNVRRAADSEALTTTTASFLGRLDFNVASAMSLNSRAVSVTFDAPPDAAQATVLANYSIPGLTLSGTPTLAGNTVTLVTSAQGAQTYAVTVTGVTRASDGEPLLVSSANFLGINTFNVASAAALSTTTVRVTFDAAPNPTQATTIGNYTIPGLALSGTPSISGNTVTLTTSVQSATTYTVMVSNVTRVDGEPLTTTAATFAGRPPFNVQSAAAVTSHSMSVTFNGAPDPVAAVNRANYSVVGLTLSGVPTLSGNTVTITTSPQSATTYNVIVANVTRMSDGEALTTNSATFAGRAPFNVAGAASTATTKVQVTFDAAPNAGQATNAANYAISGGITVSAATLSSNVVTLTTSQQTGATFTVTVTNVTRSLDAEPLTINNASFVGRPPFDVSLAASTSNLQMTVTFDAPPNVAAATNINNYSVSGLGLSGTPTLSGNTVTITTASQLVQTYTVVVSNVTRASDNEALTVNSAMFTGKTGFNVASAASLNTTTMSVTYDAPPNAVQATNIANYSVSGGLTLSGTPTLSGNTVTITTSAQAGQLYTVTVTGVTRNIDSAPLAVNMASFTHVTFNVTSATAPSSHSIQVTFDAPPNASAATTVGNYSVAGLTLSGTPSLSGNTVTITTSAQAAMTYTVDVMNVTRANDGTILSNAMATFTGRTPFDVMSAMSNTSGSISVTFDAAPNLAAATTLTNYSVPGLTLSGPVTLSGNIASMYTTAQNGGSYTVTVSNVTRASDGEPMTVNSATFTSIALATPTVTSVAVQSTVPNNGTTFYNTGTATVLIGGTDFTGVNCLTGVALNDPAATHPTSCSVGVGGTSITATFPAGISTNGATGWDVQVTNAVGTNATSAAKLVILAGLVVSEVYQGSSGGQGTTHEFIEIYNRTNNTINVSTLGLRVHIRNATGTDTNLTLTYINTAVISHGHLLVVSTDTKNVDAWYAHRDATYDATLGELLDNGSVYLSLSATAQQKVLDKLGWGTQVAGGFEGTAMANIPLDSSGQRKPAGVSGAGTDTDVNSADFNAPTTLITPLGSVDPAQP